MSIEPYFMLKMQRCEDRTRREIEREQITHPIAEYDEARVARLLQQVEAQRHWTWPAHLTVNV